MKNAERESETIMSIWKIKSKKLINESCTHKYDNAPLKYSLCVCATKLMQFGLIDRDVYESIIYDHEKITDLDMLDCLIEQLKELKALYIKMR